jgi:hypothetical protein
VASFYDSPSSRACSPDNWRDELSLLVPSRSCSISVLLMSFPSPDAHCAGGRYQTASAGRLLAVLPNVVEFLTDVV